MLQFVSVLYTIEFIFGIYMFQKIFTGKKHAESRALICFCMAILFAAAAILGVLVIEDKTYATICYTSYLILFTLGLLCYYWYSREYTFRKPEEFFSNPIFHIGIVLVFALIVNNNTGFLFALQRRSFHHIYYWYVASSNNLRHIIELFWVFIVFLTISVYVRGSLNTAKLYRPRYYGVIGVTITLTAYQLIGMVFDYPLWLKNIFLIPIAGVYIYFTNYYSDNAFKNAALIYVADNLSDGFILYGEDDSLIYSNDRFRSLISEELLKSFEKKAEFEKWLENSVNINGFIVNPVVVGSNTYYLCPVTHVFKDRNTYLGTSYSMQDLTPTMERLEVVERANEELIQAAHMKSDFLANMSHEIRTPMNAVIGMAEMALREDMSEDARDYIAQIKSSGRTLINIINDILDFSKIESGKMEILPDKYNLVDEISDVALTLVTRIGDKDIELTISVAPDLPSIIYGDILRIKQILINIANNAIKFTEKGKVHIEIEYQPIADENIMLEFHVFDTGIGIKEHDIEKLFNSFQQVDTKRNRSIEGTGLGLAISKSLVLAMGGSINVESEYGKGSHFYFNIPQKIVDPEISISVNDAENKFAFGMFYNKNLARLFFKDCIRLGVFSTAITRPEMFDPTVELYKDILIEKRSYFFFEEERYDDEIRAILDKYPRLTGIAVVKYNSLFKADLPNLRILRKPMSTYGIKNVFNDLEIHVNHDHENTYELDFIAPDANILIVDDNSINITIAEGLLQPLGMNIDACLSGKEAIDLMNQKKYDLIFMDHMMPLMDGVETTRVIRRTMPEYDDVPIIALSANAISGVKEFFLREGMNDFVPKPIEVRDIVGKVKQWLPERLLIKNIELKAYSDEEDSIIEIEGMECAEAIKMLGSQSIYLNVIKTYYDSIDDSYDEIMKHYNNQNWKDYAIKVHALKSSSRQIGAMTLGDMAYELELAGKEENADVIIQKNDDMLGEFLKVKAALEPYCIEQNSDIQKETVDNDTIKSLLDNLCEACDELDMDSMDRIIGELDKIAFDGKQTDIYMDIKHAAEDMDVDLCQEKIDEMCNLIGF